MAFRIQSSHVLATFKELLCGEIALSSHDKPVVQLRGTVLQYLGENVVVVRVHRDPDELIYRPAKTPSCEQET